MARTFSKSANEFIDNNIKGIRTISAAGMAVNIAVQDVMGIVRKTLIHYCPHQEICERFTRRGGCDCDYLNKHIAAIKSDKNLCYTNHEQLREVKP